MAGYATRRAAPLWESTSERDEKVQFAARNLQHATLAYDNNAQWLEITEITTAAPLASSRQSLLKLGFYRFEPGAFRWHGWLRPRAGRPRERRRLTEIVSAKKKF